VLLLAGYVAFKRSPKGRSRDLGRVGIGLGLMLLALHGLVETIQPVSNAPVLREILGALTGDPALDALETPYLALANAAREILRMGDLVDAMLRLVPMAMSTHDKTTAAQATRLGRELDTLHEAVKSCLAKLDRADLTERDTVRLSDLIEFAVNIGHAGDILERRIALAANRPEAIVGDLDRDAAVRIQAWVGSEPKLALSTMMTEDQRSARELIDAKRAVNDAERMASRDHLARLGGGDEAARGASPHYS
jgi:phosphate:Na+ symporter